MSKISWIKYFCSVCILLFPRNCDVWKFVMNIFNTKSFPFFHISRMIPNYWAQVLEWWHFLVLIYVENSKTRNSCYFAGLLYIYLQMPSFVLFLDTTTSLIKYGTWNHSFCLVQPEIESLGTVLCKYNICWYHRLNYYIQ